MDYLLLKTLHVSAVILSGTGFALRFAGRLAGASWVDARATRILPHIIDTVLLFSAVALVITLGINPVVHGWLMVKIVALLAYIALGMVALKASRPRAVRLSAGLAALVLFLFIVSVAISKQPAGFLAV